MTRVGTIGIGAPSRRAARPASGFALAAGREGGAAERALAVGATTLLALQEQPPADAATRGLRRAESTLDALRGLQLDLLRGEADATRLERLATLAGADDAVADPALREAVAAVRLRARVELARRRAQEARLAADASRR